MSMKAQSILWTRSSTRKSRMNHFNLR